MTDYRDNYYGSILDPLHGDVKLSEIEKWCLSNPLFSRLRYIKQNTFLYYVFPSANHTRFEHSIGVMHMAGKIFDSCKENFATGDKKRLKYSQQKESFFNLRRLNDLEPIYYQELRLAGLLHDLGHGPMSHLFDGFSISANKFLQFVKEEKALKKYLGGFKALIKSNLIEHEILSCAFIFSLIADLKEVSKKDTKKFSDSAKKLINAISAERIVAMIEPKFQGLDDKLIDEEKNDYTNFFSKIITAFPIDADRMDYLIRDSYFTGVTYGIYDLNRIYSSFQARRDKKKVELVFKESGLDAILRFIQSRTHLYNQVYFHKTNRAVNTMLSYATTSIKNKSKAMLDSCKDFKELREFYLKNSDEVFVKITIKKLLSGIEEKVLNELISRKLFKRVFDRKIVLIGDKKSITGKKKKIGAIRDAIRTKLYQLKKKNIFAEVDLYYNDTFKDANDKNVHLARKSDTTREYELVKTWNDVSQEFRSSNMTICVLRIYLRRTFHSSTEYNSFCDTIRGAVKKEIFQLRKFPN